MDDFAQQSEELESLEAIYGPGWAEYDDVSGERTVPLGHGWRARVALPSCYPSADAPVLQIVSPRAHTEEFVSGLARELEEMFEMQRGTPCLFQWIEHLRERVSQHEEQQALTVPPSPPHAAAASPDSTNAAQYDEGDIEGELETIRAEEAARHAARASKAQQAPEIDCPDILHDEPFTDRKSTFQAHVAPVTSPAEVARVVYELLQNGKIARATHNIMAFRIAMPNGTVMQDCDDDGEHGASQRMLHVMQILDVRNVVVVVSRWFGGIMLGPDRFKHINNTARNALLKYGYAAADGKAKKR
eukprot:m.251557 g.251557  ORF g.251557 m.251557 type:complete len:302 (-) comp17307_c0_seq1:356-1261(-)